MIGIPGGSAMTGAGSMNETTALAPIFFATSQAVASISSPFITPP